MSSIFGFINSETPKYNLIKSYPGFQVREYLPQVTASTVYSSSEMVSSNGFRKIAGYIFGKNKTASEENKSEKIAMTAPVIVQSQSTKIAMTAPVIVTSQEKSESNEPEKYQMTFVMPSKYQKISDLPEPLDSTIILAEIPGQTVAVLKFTGSYSSNNKFSEQESQLRKMCLVENIELDPNPNNKKVCFYNPPWAIPFLRTNEVHIPVLNMPKEAVIVK